MKTSNYILTAFLTFGFVIILTLFIDAKLYGKNLKKKEINKIKSFTSKNNLADFSVLVAEEASHVVITNDTINTIAIEIYKHEEQKKKQSFSEFFKVKNDTLFVKKADSTERIFVNVKSIKKVIGKKNSKINLSGLYNDTLSFYLDKTILKGFFSNTLISFLEIDANNHSNINFEKTYYKVLDSINKKPKYKVSNRLLKHSKITLKNYSDLTMHNIRALTFITDSTSSYKIIK